MDEIKELSGDEAVFTLTPSFLRIVFTELMLTPPLADVAPEADCGVEGLLDSVVLALVALFEALALAVAVVTAVVLVAVVVLVKAEPPGVDGGVLDWVCCCWSFWRMVDEMDSLMDEDDKVDETRSLVCLDSECCWADWFIDMSVVCCWSCCCCWICCCCCCCGV